MPQAARKMVAAKRARRVRFVLWVMGVGETSVSEKRLELGANLV